MEQQEITEICVNALKEAYFTQRRLLEDRTIADRAESHGEDQATKGDWESEEAVIKYLKDKEFPGRIIAEEHGEINVVKDPKYLAILDGIDGSSALVDNIESRCGTILTISDNLNPTYNDFIFSGITEYITDRICYGIKGNGVWMIDDVGENEKERRLPKFHEKPFSNERIIKIDCYDVNYAPGVTEGLEKFKLFMKKRVVDKLDGRMILRGGISSAAMCLDLLLGDVDALAQIVAKGVFEPPAMYFLTKELGGYSSDLEGKDLGVKKWGPVGMNVDAAIFANSEEMGRTITDYLRIKQK